MQRIVWITLCVAVLAVPATAQDTVAPGGRNAGDQSTSSSSSQKAVPPKDGKPATAVKSEESQASARFVTTPTNIQIEVNLTDQIGGQAPEKKTVSMIVANRMMGKIRSAATVMPPGESPYAVQLNFDARPSVLVDGPIQVEMTMEYAPSRNGADPKEKRPTGINQSQTVILQSGKPMIVAQAADPVSDRKVIVEVKATILK